jgi:hypothetical protein
MLGIPRICSIKKLQRVIEGRVSTAAATGHVQWMDRRHYKDRPEVLSRNCLLSRDLCCSDFISFVYAEFLHYGFHNTTVDIVWDVIEDDALTLREGHGLRMFDNRVGGRCLGLRGTSWQGV